MNSSNDPLDKLLQQRFQQLFDGEQAVPDASLKQKIWNRLPSTVPHRHRPVGLVWLGVLLLIGVGFYYGISSSSAVSKRADLREPHLTTRSVTQRHHAGQPSAGVGSVSQASVEPVVPKRMSMREPVNTHLMDVNSSTTSKIGRLWGRESVRPLASSTTDLDQTHRSLTIARHPLFSRSRTTQLAGLLPHRSRFRRPLLPSSSQPQAASRRLIPPPTTELMNDSSTNEPGPALAIVALNWRPLEDLLNSQLSARLTRRVNFLTPTVASSHSALARSAATATWFFTASPLSTYQRMTIIAKTDTYVQDVSSPTPWSGQTWGYQVGGGVRWRGGDVAVSYGQLRRWAYYERAIDAYQVEPTSPTAYQVKRQLEAVAENVSLSLVGLGIGKQYTWGKHHRYFAQASAQLTYVLTTHQPLGWLQAGWGLSLPLGKEHQLQVGPTLAYSLSDIWSTDHQLQIHPYTAGLSLTIRP